MGRIIASIYAKVIVARIGRLPHHILVSAVFKNNGISRIYRVVHGFPTLGKQVVDIILTFHIDKIIDISWRKLKTPILPWLRIGRNSS